MKTKLCFLSLLTGLYFSNNVSAQNNVKHSVKERKVAGITYVIEQWGTESASIENKSRNTLQLAKENKVQCEYNFLDNDDEEFIQSRKNVVKSVFSDAKIKQLSRDGSNNLVVICICNKAGEIKAVSFLRVKTSAITLKEIKALEDKFLKLKVKMNNTVCPETTYFRFTTPIRFKDNL